jgi:chromosome segregation ATPase
MGVRVTVDLTQLAKSFDEPLRESIRELQHGYQTISECLDQTTAQCELRAAELGECRRELADVCQDLAARERELRERDRGDSDERERIAAFQQQLDSIRHELDEASEKARQAECETEHANQRWQAEREHNGQLQTQLQRIQEADEAASGELSCLQQQLARLADSAVDAARIQDELTTAKIELAELRSASLGPKDNDALREQLRDALAQCERSERELSLIRKQTATLTESAINAAELRGEFAAAQRELTALRARAAEPSGEVELREQLATASANALQLESELAQLRAQVQSLNETALQAAQWRGELTAAQSEITGLRKLAAAPSADGEMRRLLAAALSERDQLAEEVARLHEHLTALTARAVDAARWRGELTAAQAEIARLCEQKPEPLAGGESLERLAAAVAQRDQLASEVTELCEHLSLLTESGLTAAELRGQLSAAQAEVTRLRAEAALPTADGEARQQLAAALAERTRLEAELSRLQQQVASLTTEAIDSAQLRGELSAARGELARLRELASRPAGDDGLREKLAATAAQRDQFEQEVARLHEQLATTSESLTAATQLRGDLSAIQSELLQWRDTMPEVSLNDELRDQLAAAVVSGKHVEKELSSLQERVGAMVASASEAAKRESELTATKAELDRLRDLAAGGVEDGSLRERLAAAQADRDRLEAELACAQAQVSTASETAVVAGELRGQLTATQAELARLRELANLPSAETQLREELGAVELQRQQLEAELDSVRLRTAELQDTLEEQQRLVAEERQQWNEELRRLRRAVERQAEASTRRSRRSSAATEEDDRRATNGVALAATERRADPVIDTVREQFEALQKRKSAGARARSQ